ncbi:MAG TPA: Jag N-terminal domain-containing protein [Candidatus Caccovivens faecavium]|nr:Jag N-terminal domain-containing protein [Candidatus Caccovivens faecavium]
MLSCEGTGKNIEQAVENALFELKASREDVDIKILNPGGFLKKAKVLVTISEDAREKYEKKEKLKQQEQEEETKIEVNVHEPKINVEQEKVKADAEQPKISVEKPKVQIITDEEYVSVQKEDKGEINVKTVEPEKLIKDILEALDLTADIAVSEDEKFIRYSLTGENLNDLIGHHGECLYALSSFISSVCKNDKHKKVVLDVENYRSKREETLRALAERIANKVAKSGRYYKFEPMDASERKIIHTALQNDDRVTTMSKGEEPRRYLIVFPREYKE